MSKAIEIIGDISQYIGDIQKLLLRLQSDNCTKTPEQSELAINAQSELTIYQREVLHKLQKAYE